jgi:hypothetical protein
LFCCDAHAIRSHRYLCRRYARAIRLHAHTSRRDAHLI